jgi:hypothetical protein
MRKRLAGAPGPDILHFVQHIHLRGVSKQSLEANKYLRLPPLQQPCCAFANPQICSYKQLKLSDAIIWRIIGAGFRLKPGKFCGTTEILLMS